MSSILLTKQRNICQNLTSCKQSWSKFSSYILFLHSYRNSQCFLWKPREHVGYSTCSNLDFLPIVRYLSCDCFAVVFLSSSPYAVTLSYNSAVQASCEIFIFKMFCSISNEMARDKMACSSCNALMLGAIFECRKGHLLDQACRYSILQDEDPKCISPCIFDVYVNLCRQISRMRCWTTQRRYPLLFCGGADRKADYCPVQIQRTWMPRSMWYLTGIDFIFCLGA